ncbi:MAG TPA: flagellar protein FliT [Paucimonas sp.]|nr:flagellar protein FliT [Paucimonas sp.]
MMDSQEVISLYESVAVLTDQMLTAARDGDWDQLALLESRCAGQIAALKSGEPTAKLSAATRKRKAVIIQKILQDDREIRNLTEPWMERLAELINSGASGRSRPPACGANRSG